MAEKGPLIVKKQRSNSLERPKPVLRNMENDFKPYVAPETKPEVSTPAVTQPKPQNEVINKSANVTPAAKAAPFMQPKRNKPVNNSERMIKMSKELHSKITALGTFMDEKKGYNILEKLVEHYSEHQLSERQKEQFEFLTQILTNDKK